MPGDDEETTGGVATPPPLEEEIPGPPSEPHPDDIPPPPSEPSPTQTMPLLDLSGARKEVKADTPALPHSATDSEIDNDSFIKKTKQAFFDVAAKAKETLIKKSGVGFALSLTLAVGALALAGPAAPVIFAVAAIGGTVTAVISVIRLAESLRENGPDMVKNTIKAFIKGLEVAEKALPTLAKALTKGIEGLANAALTGVQKSVNAIPTAIAVAVKICGSPLTAIASLVSPKDVEAKGEGLFSKIAAYASGVKAQFAAINEGIDNMKPKLDLEGAKAAISNLSGKVCGTLDAAISGMAATADARCAAVDAKFPASPNAPTPQAQSQAQQ